jgi:pimeloyl-ACP methyl ester carboxylesterase
VAGSVLALALIASGACTSAQPKPSSAARFASTACPADVADPLEGLAVACGFLTVPARHAEPSAGTIDLFVVRIHGPDPAPSDPLVVLGGRDIGVPVHYSDDIAAKPGRVGREVIVIEPRGTGHDRPSLACPEVDAFDVEEVGRSLADLDVGSAFTRAVEACATRLGGEGVDLGAYATEESAADVIDLATALDLPAFNVEAIGYNARIAFEVLRTSPDGLRSVYLDSPVYPGQSIFDLAVDGTRSSVEAFARACEEQAACRRSVPDLTRAADDAVAAFQQPRTVEAGGVDVELDATSVARALRDLMSVAAATVPDEIAGLASGEATDIPAWVASHRPSCFGYRPFCRMSDPPVPWGAVFSIVCREAGAPTSNRETSDEPSSLLGVLVSQPYLDACRVWPLREPITSDQEPMATDVPVLLLHGELDPTSTPPDQAAMAAMSHAYPYVFVGQSTNPLGRGEEDCAQGIRAQFVTDPTSVPDSTCLASLVEPQFGP